MGLFGNSLMPGESGGMRDEDWQRIYGVPRPDDLAALLPGLIGSKPPSAPVPAFGTPGAENGAPSGRRMDGVVAPIITTPPYGTASPGGTGASALFGRPRTMTLAPPDVPPQPAAASTPSPASQPAPVAPVATPGAFPGVPQVGSSFDAKGEYDRIIQQLQPKPHGSKLGHILLTAAQILGPAMMAAGGNEAGANAIISQMAQRRRDASRDRQEMALQMLKWRQGEYSRTANLAADTAKPFTVGRDRVQYDPTTGEAHTLYHGPQDFEAYAGAQGLQPGSDGYNRAVQDYVLRSSGPTALDNGETLDDYRTGNRSKLEGLRQTNRVSMEGLRQQNRVGLRGTPSYRDTHPLPGRTPGGSREVTATGPNGQKIKLVNGQWVPVQ